MSDNIRYVITAYTSGRRIERVEIVKETAEFVMVPATQEVLHGHKQNPRRIRKEDWHGRHVFHTFDEAKAELVDRAERNVAYKRDQLAGAEQHLAAARALAEFETR